MAFWNWASDLCKPRFLSVVLIPLLMVGCSVSKSMRVRTGEDPVHKDSDVRFRTTYYFRVFDACEGLGEVENTNRRDDTVLKGVSKGPYHLRTDSLYRFRMTGKGYSLFQRIHFESGTLRKEEIDPFGSTVVFDSKTNRFVYKSREETQSDARREARFLDIERLRLFRETLKGNEEAIKAIDQIILKQIRGLEPTDIVSRSDVSRGAAQMPSVLAEFVAARDRAQGLVQEVAVLKEIVKGPAKSLEVAASRGSDRAKQLYGDAKVLHEQLRKELEEASKVRDSLLEGVPGGSAGGTARAAIEKLKILLAGLKIDALTRETPLADQATATDIEGARTQVEALIAGFPRLIGEANAVVAAFDGLRTGGTQPDVSPDKIAGAYQRARGLVEALGGLKDRAGAASAGLANAGAAIRIWLAVNEAGTKRADIEKGLPSFDEQAKTAASNLIDVAKKADDAAGAAAEAAQKLLLKADSGGDAAKAYAEKAVELVKAADAPRATVAQAAALIQKLAVDARAALRGLVELARPEDPNFAAARQAFEEMVTRLTMTESSWTALSKSVTSLAVAATQIAGTMTKAPGRPAEVDAKNTTPGSELVACPSGTTARRGFQILGPEGWRTFDQDERLIMAMSSSAKPLLGALQEISRNVLNAQQNPADALLALVKERLRIIETDRKAERYENVGGAIDQIIQELVTTFGRAVSSEAKR